MKQFKIFASAATIAAATFASGTALADCASELSALRDGGSQMQSAATQTDGMTSQDSQSGKMPADKTPADYDQDAAAGHGDVVMNQDTPLDPTKKEGATRELTGIEPAAAMEKAAGGIQADSESSQDQASAASDDAEMTTASTSPDSGQNNNEMVSEHLAAAQDALDAGNEEACMKAVEAARMAM